jgi:hypothetical protein
LIRDGGTNDIGIRTTKGGDELRECDWAFATGFIFGAFLVAGFMILF